MGVPRFDRDEVGAEMRGRIPEIIGKLGIPGRRSGSQWRTHLCPRCGPRTRDAVAISLADGLWIDHAHQCAGDGFDLVGAFDLGVDAAADFPAVLARTAELLGMAPAERPHASARAERDRREQERRDLEAAATRDRRAHARAVAGAAWLRCSRSSAAGEAYLRVRGLDAGALIARDLVRFSGDGDPAVALYASDGAVINVVRRLREPRVGGAKVLGLGGCPTAGTLVGALPAIVGSVDVIAVEGVADALTAALAWPGAIVLGAHGCARMAMVAEAAARRVRLAGGRLLLGCHADEAGTRATTAAGRAAMRAGLEIDRTLIIIEHGDAKDLNDAWSAGWRP